MKRRRKFAGLLAAAAIPVGGLGGVAVSALAPQPVGATTNQCNRVDGFNWASQQDMADAVDGYCRSTWLLDPGTGNLISRAFLLSAGSSLYNSKGFNDNFLWYAPESQMTIGPGNPTLWTECVAGTHGYYGGDPACSPGNVVLSPTRETIAQEFNGNTVTLDTFSYDGNFIARVCGNYGVTSSGSLINGGSQAPYPVPTITGSKYSDLNHDGQRQSNEPGVKGWPMTLSRVSSLYGDQSAGYVTTTYTDANGNYSFPLDGIGPGTYTITEGPDPTWDPSGDWYPETGTTRTVVVPAGIGDATIGVSAFGNHDNLAPVAQIQAGGPYDLMTAQGTTVTLDGSGSHDPDNFPSNGIVSYTWSGPFQTFTTTTPTAQVTLPAGNDSVSLTVSDGALTSQLATTTVTVFPNITANGVALSGTEGTQLSGTLATFSDPDPNSQASEYTASVNWGDGSAVQTDLPIVGSHESFSVAGAHTYADEGTYAPSVTIQDVTDDPYNQVTVTDEVQIGDAALTASLSGSLSAVEGSAVTGVAGSFSDVNPMATTADYTATIDWGDGSSSTGAVKANPDGTFSVNGSHTYSEEGTYSTVATVSDDGGSTTTVDGQVNVTDAALMAHSVAAATTNPLSNLAVATFTDSNPDGYLNDFTATIDWGDGTVSAGTITGPVGPSSGPYTVSGSHTYTTLGFKTIKVHIVDDGGQTADVIDSDSILVYAPGNFVVGDLSIGAFSQGAVANGANVNFWGSQWWKNNDVSGNPSGAPAAFKGYATTSQGSSFTSSPGNTAGEPDAIPAYMSIIVTNGVTQSGSAISGSIVHQVIVKTDNGYASDPGHPGTGTIVWDLG